MKKFFVFLLIVVGGILPCQVVAQDFTVDGIYYNITSAEEHTVAVTSGTKEYVGSVVIPETVACDGETYSVTAIGESAFYSCNRLTSVIIPNSVTNIGGMAFYSCIGLTSITIPNSVTTIGERAFNCCDSLACIVVDADNPAYDSRNNCNAIIETSSNTLICGCKNTIIPNSVTAIGYRAFQCCSGLTSITIGNSVTTIGEEAFNWCSGLTSITIPNSVTSIGVCAFGCSGLTSITIPNSVTTIGERAFYNCSGLTSITIGNSVTTIGTYAFSGCGSLVCIVVDAGNPVYDSRDNCNAIIETSSNALIYGCKNTIIPNSVTTIGWSAFYDCSGLTSIAIPNSVTTIDVGAFFGCIGLTSITIPNSVTTIGEWAFYSCIGLISITIGNSVTTIGEWAFSGCNGLTSITIPNSVTTIGNYAFDSCSALKDFYCHAENVPTASNNIFSNVKLSSATLHVPEVSLQEYSSTAPWSGFGQIVALTESDGIERLTSEANRPTTVYSLDGRRVAKPRKGIYVIGGRKTVVR